MPPIEEFFHCCKLIIGTYLVLPCAYLSGFIYLFLSTIALYHKIPNINPELIVVCKHILVGMCLGYSEGLID